MFYSLPIHLLRQYCFCERIPNFQELLKLNPVRPQWVKQGEKLHEKQQKTFQNRTLKRFGLEKAEQVFEITVSYKPLQMHGIVDSCLITKTQVYPIEFKLAGKKPTKGQLLQLTAYGMLLEKIYKRPCKTGFILYAEKGKTHTVNFSEQHKQQVLKVRDKIIAGFNLALMPHSSATPAQCTQCEYLNYCNDRE